MNRFYLRVHIPLLEDLPDFFRKLKRYLGNYRIEAQTFDDEQRGIVTISFYSEKLGLRDTKDRQVDLTIKRNERNAWYFISVNQWGS